MATRLIKNPKIMIPNYRYKPLILAIFIVFIFTSCEKNNCLSSAGEIVSEERILPSFKHIVTNNHFQIYLKNDTIHKIEIEAGNKLLPFIETKVENDTLTITNYNKCDFIKGYADKKLYISVDTLNAITINNASDLYTIDTFKVKNLKILFLSNLASCDITIDANSLNLAIWYASGNFIVRGNTNYANLSTEQTAFIYAENLKNKSCTVSNNSMGDCYIKAGRWIYYYIKDEGNIYYTGSPDSIFVKEHTGKGNIINIE